jgi:hypothetical protein
VPSGAALRDPWSSGDLNRERPGVEPLQFRRNTALGFQQLNPVLWAGEPAWEIDDKKGKIGDGTTRYNSLPYAFGNVGGASTPTAPPQTMLGNKNATGTPNAAVTALTPSEIRDIAKVPFKDDYDNLVTSVQGHIDSKRGDTLTVAGTSTVNSVTVQFSAPLPARVSAGWAIEGPGLPLYSRLHTIAADRLSGTISNSIILPNANWKATASSPFGAPGAGNFVLRNTHAIAHGMYVGMMPNYDGFNYFREGESSGMAYPVSTIAPGKWRDGWNLGIYRVSSYEHPTASQLHPLEEYTPMRPHLMVAVPSALQSWASFPTTTPAEMFASSRYKLLLPIDGQTQAKIVVDYMGTGATPGSGAKLKAQWQFGSGWVDLGETTPAATPIEVAIDQGDARACEGAWGKIDDAALSVAAAQGGFLLIRLVGFAASAAGTPTFGSIHLWTK